MLVVVSLVAVDNIGEQQEVRKQVDDVVMTMLMLGIETARGMAVAAEVGKKADAAVGRNKGWMLAAAEEEEEHDKDIDEGPAVVVADKKMAERRQIVVAQSNDVDGAVAVVAAAVVVDTGKDGMQV